MTLVINHTNCNFNDMTPDACVCAVPRFFPFGLNVCFLCFKYTKSYLFVFPKYQKITKKNFFELGWQNISIVLQTSNWSIFMSIRSGDEYIYMKNCRIQSNLDLSHVLWSCLLSFVPIVLLHRRWPVPQDLLPC